eukprot:COSAG01_NODE_23_length_37704_cov_30.005877_9_plen_52_part_00
MSVDCFIVGSNHAMPIEWEGAHRELSVPAQPTENDSVIMTRNEAEIDANVL